MLLACLQHTVIKLNLDAYIEKNDISVAQKVKGKFKIPYFSLWIEIVHPDSKVTAPRKPAIWCPVYESIRSFLELLKSRMVGDVFCPGPRWSALLHLPYVVQGKLHMRDVGL